MAKRLGHCGGFRSVCISEMPTIFVGGIGQQLKTHFHIFGNGKKWKVPKPLKGGVDKEKNALKRGVFFDKLLIYNSLTQILGAKN